MEGDGLMDLLSYLVSKKYSDRKTRQTIERENLLADRKEIKLLWELGNIGPGGALYDSTTRIRTTNFIVPTTDIEIFLLDTSMYKYYVFMYTSNGTFETASGWITNAKYTLYAGHIYKILMTAQTENTITSISDVASNLIVCEKSVDVITPKHIDDPLLTMLSQYTGYTKKYTYNWELGALQAATSGANPPPSFSASRIYTPNIYYADIDVSIINTDPSKHQFGIFYFDNNGAYLNSVLWLTDSIYTIPAGSHYKLMLAYVAGTEMTTLDIDALVSKFAFVGGAVKKRSIATIDDAIPMLSKYSKRLTMPWVKGVIMPDGTQYTGTPARLAVLELQYASEDILISNVDSSRYKFGVLYYEPTGGTVLSYRIWLTHDKYIIPKGSYFRLIAAYVNDSAISDITDISDNLIFMQAVSNIDYDYDPEYIPYYWISHLNEKINTINNLQCTDGSNKFSFIVVADVHWASNYQRSPGLIRKIVNECRIPYLLLPGDFTTDATTKDKALANMRKIIKIYSSLGALMLPTMGNHDDNSYHTDSSLNGLVSNTIVKGEQYSEVFRQLGNQVEFGETGTYFYFDDRFHKIRIISLDVLDMSYEADENGKMKYKSWGFRQKQLDWLCKTALNVPSDEWSIIVMTHIPPGYTSTEMIGTGTEAPYNSVVMLSILEAFKNKTSYSTTILNGNDYDITINVDFSNGGGNVIAVVCGHCHYDHLLKWNNSIPVITTLDDSYHVVGDAPTRTKGTITEQAFDVFTVDKTNRTVYVTRIGAGSDRSFTY